MSRKIINASEMGKKGGAVLLERYGREHFAKIGAKGRASLREKDPDFYKRLALIGVEARKKKREEKKQQEKKEAGSVNGLVKLLTGRQT